MLIDMYTAYDFMKFLLTFLINPTLFACWVGKSIVKWENKNLREIFKKMKN